MTDAWVRPVAAFAAAAVVASLAAISAGASPPAAPPISADALLSRIERARDLAVLGQRAPSQAGMTSVRSTLGLPVSVRLGDTVVRLAPDPFLARLDGSSAADFSGAAEHLDELTAAVHAADATPTISTSDVDAALARAYSGVPRRSLLARYVGAVERLVVGAIERWIDSLDASHGVGSAVAWGALALLLAAGVAVLRRLGVGFVPEPVSARPVAAAPVDWRVTAERALAQGDVALAVVATYHVLLATLASRGVVPGNPALTAGECRAAVARAMPTAYGRVAPATEAFERVAYGGRAPSAGDVEALRAAARAVEAA